MESNSPAYKVLATGDILSLICDWHCVSCADYSDPEMKRIKLFIRRYRNASLLRYLDPVETADTINSLMFLASEVGNLEAIQILVGRSNGSTCDFNPIIDKAASNGHIHILQWLQTNNYINQYIYISIALDYAAAGGHHHVLKWVHANMDRSCYAISENAAAWAAKNGHLGVLQWLYEKGNDYYVESKYSIDNAAADGHLDVLKWLCTVHPKKITDYIIYNASENGNLDVVIWFCENYPQYRNIRIEPIIKAGHSEVIKWIHNNLNTADTHINGNCLSKSVTRGDVDLVDWVYTHYSSDPRWIDNTVYLVARAAEYGQLEMIKYFYSGFKLSNSELIKAFQLAAQNGQLHVIKWMHENIRKPVATALIMTDNVRSGNLEIIEWLYANKYVIQAGGLTNLAALHGHLNIIQWLHDNINVENTLSAPNAADWAAARGRLDIVKWLFSHHKSRCTYKSMASAARDGHINVLKWLYVNVLPKLHITELREYILEGMKSAMHSNNLDIFKWIYYNSQNLYPYNITLPQNLLIHLIKCGNNKFLKFLKQKGFLGNNKFALEESVHFNNLDTVSWMYNEGYIDINKFPSDESIWVYSNDPDSRSAFIKNMCQYGNLEALQWFSNIVNITEISDIEECIRILTINGYINILKWLRDIDPIRVSFKDIHIKYALEHGHTHVVVWLKQLLGNL